MQLTPTGLYKRSGPYVDLQLSKGDSHQDVVNKGVEILELDDRQSYKLFTARGCLISNHEIVLSDSCDIRVPWTIANYMRSKHAGSGSLKFGVGSTDVSNVSIINNILCAYYKPETYYAGRRFHGFNW